MIERVDMNKMKAAHPDLAALWDLSSAITGSAFGDKDIFPDRSEEEDLALQTAGAALVPELTSGRYDIGLAAAVKGNVGNWKSPNFRSLLASYRGPVSAAEAKAAYVPELVNAQSYRLTCFAPPKYPPLALQARIQGKVELQVAVEPSTGEVRDVSAISGHPLLKPAAIDAAKQWRFVPNSVPAETVILTVDFALRCPSAP